MQIELPFPSLRQQLVHSWRKSSNMGAHLRVHLRQQIFLIHENPLAPLVWRNSLNIWQARLDIIAEPLSTTITRRLVDDSDHTPTLKLVLHPRPIGNPTRSQHLFRASHTERIIISHRDPRRRHLSDRRAPLANERTPSERVMLQDTGIGWTP